MFIFITGVLGMKMFKKSKAKLFPILLAIAVMFGVLPSVGVYADAESYDYDVVFVIDSSGSMLKADPDKLALSAANLFIDMSEDSDTYIGYVMFTGQIVAQQPLTDIETFSNELKRAIANSDYVSNGNTDIALGLEKAYDILERQSLGGKSDRKPVVILLSDGNTDLGASDSRTTGESLAALEVMKNKFADAEVPVFTIGLNYDNSMDINELKSISDMTGALMQEVKTAGELPSVLRNIFGHLTDAKSTSLDPIEATGGLQTVTIPIANNSIYKATITISAKDKVTDVSLESPGGDVYGDSGKSGKLSVNKDPNDKYVCLILYYPEMGDWNLTFKGTAGDIVQIDLLSVYEIQLVLEDPIVSKDQVTVSWHLEDGSGNKVDDPDLIDGLTVTLHANKNSVVEEFPSGSQSETFTLAPGNYDAYLTMESASIKGTKKSNSKTFTVLSVKDIEIETIQPSAEIKLITLFNTKKIVYHNEMISYEPEHKPLETDFGTAGNWRDYYGLDYDRSGECIEITAVKSGKEGTLVTVTAANGSSAEFYINVSITSGWLIIGAAAAVLLLIAVIILLVISKSKPYLDDPLRDFLIQVNLPDHEIEYTPPEAIMRLEHVKAKRTLQSVFNFNRESTSAYNNAFNSIGWLASGTVLCAKSKRELSITVPSNNRFTVRVDGRKISGAYTGLLSKKRKMTVELIQNDDIYQIIFGEEAINDYGGQTDWNDWNAGGDSGNTVQVDDGFDFL